MSAPSGFISMRVALEIVETHLVNPLIARRELANQIANGAITAWAETIIWRNGSISGLNETGDFVDPELFQDSSLRYHFDLRKGGAIAVGPAMSGRIDFERNMSGIFLHEAQLLLIWPRTQDATRVAPSQISMGRKRGANPTQMARVSEAMALLDRSLLSEMKEEEMKARFGASRDTCRRARAAILRSIDNSRQMSTIDK